MDAWPGANHLRHATNARPILCQIFLFTDGEDSRETASRNIGLSIRKIHPGDPTSVSSRYNCWKTKRSIYDSASSPPSYPSAFNGSDLATMPMRLAMDSCYKPNADIRLFLNDSFAELRKSHSLQDSIPAEWPVVLDVEKLLGSIHFFFGSRRICLLSPMPSIGTPQSHPCFAVPCDHFLQKYTPFTHTFSRCVTTLTPFSLCNYLSTLSYSQFP